MIIDAHTHIWLPEHIPTEWTEESKRKGSAEGDTALPEDLIKEMDAAGVDKAVVLAHELAHVWRPPKAMNPFVVDAVKRYPSRLIGFVGAAPLDRFGKLNRKSLEDVERYIVEDGMRGMKMLPIYENFKPNDRQVYPFYEKAVELRVPIMVHQAATLYAGLPMEKGHPLHLVEPLQDYPEVTFIAAHMAYPWTEELLAIMRMQKNLYADLSSSLLKRRSILGWDLAMAKEYGVIDRVLFGTDYPVVTPRDHIGWLKNEYNVVAQEKSWPTLTPPEIQGILGGNAARLLGI